MSRVASNPVIVPAGVKVSVAGSEIEVEGKFGTVKTQLHPLVDVAFNENLIKVAPKNESNAAGAHAGTARANIQNMVKGVHQGFERKLNLVGVGYRAQAKEGTLNLSLGYSHPVEYRAPDGVSIETPSQTEILVKGSNRQMVGQVAAEIRRFRPPEPYKGKGVRYSDEVIVKKEAKKK